MLFLADAGCGAEKSHEPPLVNVNRAIVGDANAVAVAPAPAGVSSHSPSSPPPSPFPSLARAGALPSGDRRPVGCPPLARCRRRAEACPSPRRRTTRRPARAAPCDPASRRVDPARTIRPVPSETSPGGGPIAVPGSSSMLSDLSRPRCWLLAVTPRFCPSCARRSRSAPPRSARPGGSGSRRGGRGTGAWTDYCRGCRPSRWWTADPSACRRRRSRRRRRARRPPSWTCASSPRIPSPGSPRASPARAGPGPAASHRREASAPGRRRHASPCSRPRCRRRWRACPRRRTSGSDAWKSSPLSFPSVPRSSARPQRSALLGQPGEAQLPKLPNAGQPGKGRNLQDRIASKLFEDDRPSFLESVDVTNAKCQTPVTEISISPGNAP